METTGTALRFSWRFYIRTLSQLLKEPKAFFSELPDAPGMAAPLGFLLVSSLVFTLASLMNAPLGPLAAGSIYFANAVGMVFIASGLGWTVTRLTTGHRHDFIRFFAVYAFSAGVTLLASWMPYFLIITEPWKWWMIYIGLTRSLQLRRTQALTVIGLSIGLVVLLFWMLMPLVT